MRMNNFFLNSIKSHNSIPAVLQILVPGIQNKGASGYIGRVPWREDNNPSFSVKQQPDGSWVWQDWADADASGDIIELVKRVNGLAFLDAVKWLAQELGITMKNDVSDRKIQSPLLAPKRRLEGLQRLYAISHQLDDNLAATAYMEARGLLGAARLAGVQCFEGGEPTTISGKGGQYGIYSLELWAARKLPYLVYGGMVDGIMTAYRFRLCMSQREARAEGLKAVHCSPVRDGIELPTIWPAVIDASSEIVFTEGETDALAVRSLVPSAKAYAILGTSGMGYNTEVFREIVRIRPKKVILAFQRDQASSTAAKKIQSAFRKQQIKCIGLLPKGKGKDWADRAEWDKEQHKSLDSISDEMNDYSLNRMSVAFDKRLADVRDGKIRYVPLPWKNLSDTFGGAGIPPSTLGLLVAHMGVGKTWMTYQLAVHAAKTMKVFILNTEMPEYAVYSRLLAAKACDAAVIHMKNVDVIQKYQEQYGSDISSSALNVTEAGIRTPADIVDMIAEQSKKADLLILDHLGDIDTCGEPSYTAIPKMVRKLQEIAQAKECSIIIVSHMRKSDSGVEALSYSKAMENIVDWSWQLQAFPPKITKIKPNFYDSDLDININRIIKIRKNRYGTSGMDIGYNFHKDILTLCEEGHVVSKGYK